jgi:phosphonate transport system substrate-binding protein
MRRRSVRCFAALSLGVALLAGCSEQEEPQRVRLWALAPPEVHIEEDGQSALHFAVALTVSPQEGYRLYGDLSEVLGQKIGRPVHLILRNTFSEVNDLVRSRQADLAQLCSRGFLQGRADFGLSALAVAVVNGRTTHPSYIVVSAESDIGTPGELKGKSFAFADPLCAREPFAAGRGGQPLDGFFKQKLMIASHDRAIRAVGEGLVDGALVDGLDYDRLAMTDPGLTAKTKVIGETAPYINPPIAVHPDLDPTLKEELRRVLLTLHELQTGQAVLARLGINRFAAPGSEVGRLSASGRGGNQ